MIGFRTSSLATAEVVATKPMFFVTVYVATVLGGGGESTPRDGVGRVGEITSANSAEERVGAGKDISSIRFSICGDIGGGTDCFTARASNSLAESTTLSFGAFLPTTVLPSGLLSS